jgi:hypothetical protein
VGSVTFVRAPRKRRIYSPRPVQARRYSAAHYLRLWAGGFAIASVAVMLVAPQFLSSLQVYQWAPAIGDYVYENGYVHRERGEGWASTSYGRFGLTGALAGSAAQVPTVLIWGDSFVEAHQVNDEQKAAAQVTQAFSRGGQDRLAALAVGHSYWCIADYYFNIPVYEKLVHPMCHFIVLAEHGLADLCPDQERFLSTPTYRFVRRPTADTHKSQITRFLANWGLQDALLPPWKVVRNIRADLPLLRLLPQHDHPLPPIQQHLGCLRLAADSDPNTVTAAWAYALAMLKGCTSKPIVLVSVPEVPALDNGKVRCEDPQAEWNARLARLCREQNIGFIDMAETLVDDYRTTGSFSRGFQNGVPGSGHLNARGQYLLSREICTYLRQHFRGSS